ncbi:MAG: hypothetical protein ACTSR8_14115 [Promethearchaeota archaeon]
MTKDPISHNSLKRYQQCPRNPHHPAVSIREKVVYCPVCGSFLKVDIDLIIKGELDEDEILTIEEMENFFDTFGGEPKDYKDFFR